MKNCLIVLVVLIGCFFAAAFLEFGINENFGRGVPSQELAEWRDYEDPGMRGVSVSIFPNQISIGIPAMGVGKEISEKGHWNLHAFYCDSHVDSPAEVEVARETKDEDLVVDIGRFVPSHPGKITLVKWVRGMNDGQPGYPVYADGQVVSYPPPKGLIRVGMLQCDLDRLPWHADEVDIQNDTVHGDFSGTLSDGSVNQNYFPGSPNGPPPALGDIDENAQIYNYHSDRADAPKLLVTVYHGRVTEVNGGAEETADIPYQLPTPAPSPEETPDTSNRSWGAWLFDLIFTK